MLMSVMMADAAGSISRESQAMFGHGSLDVLLYLLPLLASRAPHPPRFGIYYCEVFPKVP